MANAATFVLAVLTHTPIWVWAIFALIVVMGVQRTRDRTVALWRLLILPVVMIVTAVSGMVGAGVSMLPAILVGIAVGGVSGWLLERDGATRRLPDGRLWLRGEWWSLVQVVLIFGVRYTMAVTSAVAPALSQDGIVHMLMLLVSSLLSAMVLGRTLARLRIYFTAAPVAA